MNLGIVIVGCAMVFAGATDQIVDAIRPRNKVIPFMSVVLEGVGLLSVIWGAF